MQGLTAFKWPKSAVVFEKGQMFSPHAGAGPLAVLQRALTSGRDFRATAKGIQPIRRAPDGIARMECETSGSAGKAKVIRRTQASWLASFDVMHRRFGIGPGDVFATPGGLGQSLSLYAVIEALSLGAGVEMLAGLRPSAQAARLAHRPATVLYATPTQLRLLAAACDDQLPKMRLVLSGGGKLDAATRAATKAMCPCAEIIEFYGASETSFIAIADAGTPEGAVGRAFPGVSLDIRNAVDGIGEIWVRSPYLFERYAQGDSAHTIWQGDALSVGELGWQDRAGNLFLKGRKSRMVTVADQNVFPEDIEAVLHAVPDLPEFAVLTPRDEKRGHSITLALRGAHNTGLADAALAACRTALPPVAVPRRAVFFAEFPLLASGKPDLQRLTALAEAAA